MKLFWSGASPYARKVMIAVHELGLAERIETVDGGGTPVAPNANTKAHNPLGKLPCLVRDDGPAVYDSRVICQYLCTLAPGQKLIPEGDARIAALTLEAMADGICDAAILIRYELVLRPEEKRWDDWTSGQWAKVEGALDAAEETWAAHLAGPFDLGHAALASALGYLDFRYSDREWRTGRPALAKWQAAVAQRASLAATEPQG